MKISELNIDGFGHFHDIQVGPLESPVVILYGPNEAGKTTLLEYIRTVLFGFPSRNRDNHYPPLTGGNHGGRITVFDDAGARYVIERHNGSRGGSVRVRDGSGQVHTESMLSSLLGHVPVDVFKNVFAFSLDELQTGDLLKNSNVNSQIYSAGLGATRLPEAFKALSAMRDEIYLPRGSNQVMAQLITQLGEIDNQLSAIRGNAAKYATKVADRDNIDAELDRIKCDSDSITLRRRELARLGEGWDDWVQLVNAEGKLAQLPRFERFPEDPIARLEALEARVRSAKEELELAVAQHEKIEAEANAPVDYEEILESHETITNINRGRNEFDKSNKDLPERKAERANREESLAKRLRDLGPGWDEQYLESFDTSIEVRDQIDHWKVQLSGGKQSLQRAQNGQLQRQEALVLGKEAETEARAKLEGWGDPELSQPQIDERKRALRASRTRLGEYERKKDSYSQLRYQRDALTPQSTEPAKLQNAGGVVFPVILALLAAALLTAGVILGQQALLVAAPAAGLLLVLAVFLLVKKNTGSAATLDLTGPLKGQVEAAFAEEGRALQALNEAASPLGLDSVTADQLDILEGQINATESQLRTWESFSEALAIAIRESRRGEQRVEVAVAAVDQATTELATLEARWREWLSDRGLAQTLMPETMATYLGQVESASVMLEQVKDRRHRVQAIEVDIQQYRDLVEPLAERYAVSGQSNDLLYIAIAANALVERFDAARAGVNLRKQNRELADETKQNRARRESAFRDASEEAARLLEQGGAQDAEDFRTRANLNDQRVKLEQVIQDCRSRLQRISGPGDLLNEFRDELSRTNRPEIGIEETALSSEARELEDRQNELLEERGRGETLIQQLAQDEKSSELRVQRNSLLEQLREQARKWSELKLAEAMLARARDKYQKERQPGVLRHAQNFFGGVTGGRYGRLYAPLGEQTITVEDESSSQKQPSDLSRGTREQLYLALRFGLIREFGESLPVIVDEILVNFDPERTRRAAEAFSEISRTNQVLVFTCHPAMVEAFQGACPDAQLIEIESLR